MTDIKDIISKVKEDAVTLGACPLVKSLDSIEGGALLLFSPQGREFCVVNAFPSLRQWIILKSADPEKISQSGIYIDAGDIKISGKENIALI